MNYTIPINPDRGGQSRTIKRQYQQTSTANFIKTTGSMAATGALNIQEYEIFIPDKY